MKRILILSFSLIMRDPRINRQIYFLTGKGALTVCGWGEYSKEGVEFIQADDYRPGFFGKLFCMTMLFFHFDKVFYWGMKRHRETYRRLRDLKCDIIIANDLDAMPIAIKLAKVNNAKLVADMHEYFPGHSCGFIFNTFFKGYNMRMCKRMLPLANSCITVSEGIANQYREDVLCNFTVVNNAPKYEMDLKPKICDENCIKILYHGVANSDRKILEMIEVAKGLHEHFLLELVLVSNENDAYMKEIIEAVKTTSNKVKIQPPFSMFEIAKRVNKYDLGLNMLDADALNRQLAMPNKLFEWIQGRLGIVSFPTQEMTKIINKYSIGVVTDAFTISSMVDTINSLTCDDINKFKTNSDKLASKFNAEANKEIFNQAVFNKNITNRSNKHET
jgi:hypothetical protein